MAPSSVGSSPIRHPKKGKGKSAQLPVKLTKRSPKPFLNTHIAQLVRAGILYIQGQGFKSLCEYYLGVPEWLMAQTANLMIRGFESHLQVYVLYR